jgi:NAD(P)H-flavin reductase
LYTIVDKEVLAPTISKLVIEAPLIAKKRKAGNFVIVRAHETGERIPLTIVDSDIGKGTITLIIQAIGKTTNLMTKMKRGEHFLDVAGPLGHPTPIENFGTVVCIGGGVGTAEVYPIARALKEAGNRVLSIVGARSRDLVILEKEMASISDELIITTDDGSYGVRGFVTDALRTVMDRETDLKGVYAIGPIPMMRAAAEVTREAKIKTYVSLNPIMMDGTGMCGACRVTVNGEMKFACVDGPEFDAHTVNFDELIARNKTYGDLEKLSLDRYREEQECKTVGTYEQ